MSESRSFGPERGPERQVEWPVITLTCGHKVRVPDTFSALVAVTCPVCGQVAAKETK